MLFDTLTYLPDDILVKVDRASMSVSLETRVPFLDPRVVEYAWSLPIGDKIKNGVTKKALRHLLNQRVPRELTERPKMGFGLPVDDWLRSALRPWAEELLSESALDSHGLFDRSLVRTRWREHLAGTKKWHAFLWNILMFNAWYESK